MLASVVERKEAQTRPLREFPFIFIGSKISKLYRKLSVKKSPPKDLPVALCDEESRKPWPSQSVASSEISLVPADYRKVHKNSSFGIRIGSQ